MGARRLEKDSIRGTHVMDFQPSDEMQEFLRVVRKYVETELHALEVEARGKTHAEIEPKLQELRKQNRERDWWLPQLPKEHGGLGLSVLEHGLLSAELGRSFYGHYTFNCQAPDAGNLEILLQYGTESQKEKYVKPLMEGKIRSCFSMTEPEFAGSNPIHMGTRAVHEGDEWVINGHKWFTSSADGAEFAIVMAVTDPDGPAHNRASMIIVPTSTPGFTLERNINVMGHVGEGHASHGEIRYENCRVPYENVLGGEGAGFTIAQDRLGPGRIHHCMRWIGICERSFDLMCIQARTREINPGEPLSTKQFVQGWIAESRVEINAARLVVLDAAWKIDKYGAKQTREEISLIKFYVAGVLQRVVDRAIQAHGAAGLTDEFPLSTYYRNERAGRIYDGPDEVHKVSAARQILKRY